MAKALILRFTPIEDGDGNLLYESNAFQTFDPCGIHLDFDQRGNSVTVLRSITGVNFVSTFQDYVGEIFDWIIPDIAIGQAYKIRVNKIPTWGLVHGGVEDMGDKDPDPDTPEENLTNAFCGSDRDYFMGSEGNYFICKQSN